MGGLRQIARSNMFWQLLIHDVGGAIEEAKVMGCGVRIHWFPDGNWVVEVAEDIPPALVVEVMAVQHAPMHTVN